MENSKVFFVLLGILSITSGTSLDETVIEFATGPAVVEAVCTKIETSCIFIDDKTLIRRIAYVETTDGLEKETFTSLSHKGIWRMSSQMFDRTKTLSTSLNSALMKSFSVDWSKVVWNDLQKPFYSGLAARLYIDITVPKSIQIPREVKDQAKFWKTYYNINGNEAQFVNKSANLESVCGSGAADVVFVIDSSGSIGASNFQTIKNFMKSLVEILNVGSDPNTQTRVAVISYSNSVRKEFQLDQYSTVAQYKSAIDRISYMSGGTNTHLALAYLTDNAYKTSFGARSPDMGIPKVAIVLTDGQSNSPPLTVNEANRAHAAGINMIAIGIGAYVYDQELTAIASDPVCQNKFLLNSFTELEGIKKSIEKQTCDAPINIIPDDEIDTTVPTNGTRNCKIKITKDGATIELNPTSKGQVGLYLSDSVYPTPAIYDQKLLATKGYPAVSFMKNINNTEFYMFCMIEGDKVVEVNISIEVKPGNHDACKTKKPCQNGGKCINRPNGTYECDCPYPYVGVNCEKELDICTQKTPCKNGGTCTSISQTQYKCNCSYPYVGENCENELDICSQKNPCKNGGTCTSLSQTQYKCQCPSGYSGENCQTKIEADGYNCNDKNPCTPENIAAEKFYFPHETRGKFVQCSQWGQCYEMSCPPGLSWNTNANTCS